MTTESDSDALDNWTVVQEAWRAVAPDEGATQLRARVVREKHRLVRHAVIEAVFAMSAAAIFSWLTGVSDESRRPILAALAVLALVSPIATHVWRRAVWASCGEMVRDHAAFLRKRALFGLWVGRAGYLGGPVGVAVGAWIGLVSDGLGSAVDATASLIVLLIASVALIVGMAWSVMEARRSRRMLDALEAQERGEPHHWS